MFRITYYRVPIGERRRRKVCTTYNDGQKIVMMKEILNLILYGYKFTFEVCKDESNLPF